ncbi:hypothetical protein Lal_00023767 [Lupinus albus]|nr:hypothetical protein Lal_00023767 [Lupinus albus]
MVAITAIAVIAGGNVFAAMEDMNWIQRKIYLYNVTFGLYMLDWWERFTFNTVVIVLIWFIIRHVTEFFKSHYCGAMVVAFSSQPPLAISKNPPYGLVRHLHGSGAMVVEVSWRKRRNSG